MATESSHSEEQSDLVFFFKVDNLINGASISGKNMDFFCFSTRKDHMGTRNFDMVSHKIFIEKLMKYRLDEQTVKWIKKRGIMARPTE